MKLSAIVICWSDWQWMEWCVKNIKPLVDQVIVVYSTTSNYGEKSEPPMNFEGAMSCNIEPDLTFTPMRNETIKRNFGLGKAKELGFTHFIIMDSDEAYDPEQFLKEKQRFIDNPDLAGLVCASRVYVKSPSLTIGLDTTLVPFIHKITPTLKHEFNRSYPFAWEGKAIRIDPTRSLNINSGVEWSDIVMDHYSWVRSDINRKIRNSTAKANIERTNIAKNFFHLKEGDICELYPGKPLVRVPVKYGLPEFYGSSSEDLQSIPSSC